MWSVLTRHPSGTHLKQRLMGGAFLWSPSIALWLKVGAARIDALTLRVLDEPLRIPQAANLDIDDMPDKDEVRLQTAGVALLQYSHNGLNYYVR
jgi:hypothetical protein